jgi:hypothetical protein
MKKLITVLLTVFFVSIMFAVPPAGKGPKKENKGKHYGWDKQKEKKEQNDKDDDDMHNEHTQNPNNIKENKGKGMDNADDNEDDDMPKVKKDNKRKV